MIAVEGPVLVSVQVYLARASFLARVECMCQGVSTAVEVKIIPMGTLAKAYFDLNKAERSFFDLLSIFIMSFRSN